MRYACAAAVVLFGVAVAGTASATPVTASGDTCTATGTGASYSLSITIPSTPQQFGFAFGAPGAAVTNIDIPGSNGAFSTGAGPSGTTGSWTSVSPLTPGVVVANVTTKTKVTGSFAVVPQSSTQPTYLDPISCTIAQHSPTPVSAPSRVFTVSRHVVYDKQARGWRLAVTIASRGMVTAIEPEPTHGTSTARSTTAKSLVQTRSAGLKSPGVVTLLVRPTAAGSKALAAHGSIEATLNVTFAPVGARAGSKLVTLTLKK